MSVGFKFSLLLLGLVLTTALPVQAQNLSSSALKIDPPEGSRRWNGEWNFALGGTSAEEGKDEEAAAFIWTDAKFNYTFAPWLSAAINPRLSFYSSRVQERFDDANSDSRIWLYDGRLQVKPSEYFEVHAGALNQSYHGTGMLISGLRSFPGVQEIVQFVRPYFSAKLIFQQAVPTSHSLNTEREREEKLPSFTTQTLSLEGKNFDWLEWKANAGLYKWTNLPSKIAWESRLTGSSGSGLEEANARFDYEHQGWYTTSEVCLFNGSLVGLVGEFERVRNTKAPEKASDGQLWGIGPKITLGETVLDLRYYHYFVESDTTASAYSKSRLGNTNRIGNAVEANLHFSKYNFSLFGSVYQAKTINRSETQRDLAVYYIGVETDYASF